MVLKIKISSEFCLDYMYIIFKISPVFKMADTISMKSIEGDVVETLTFDQISPSKLVASLRELNPGAMELIVFPEPKRYPPASISALCAYFRADRSAPDFTDQFFKPIVGDLVLMTGLMNIACFFYCPEFLHIVQAAFCNHYIKGKTAVTCLEGLGLPGDTIFTPEEIDQTQRTFPWLCMKHLGGKPSPLNTI